MRRMRAKGEIEEGNLSSARLARSVLKNEEAEKGLIDKIHCAR